MKYFLTKPQVGALGDLDEFSFCLAQTIALGHEKNVARVPGKVSFVSSTVLVSPLHMCKMKQDYITVSRVERRLRKEPKNDLPTEKPKI